MLEMGDSLALDSEHHEPEADYVIDDEIHLSDEDNALDVESTQHRRVSRTSVQRPWHPTVARTRKGSLPPLASVFEHDETASGTHGEKAKYHSHQRFLDQYPTAERSIYSSKPTGEQQAINGNHKNITRSVTLPDLGNPGSNSPYNSMVRKGRQLSPSPNAGERRHSSTPQSYQRQAIDRGSFQSKRSPIPPLFTTAIIESGDSWSSKNSEPLKDDADTDTTTLASSIGVRQSNPSSLSTASSVIGSEATSETTFTSHTSKSSADNEKDVTKQQKDTPKPPWDLFRMVPWNDAEGSHGSPCDSVVKLIKLAMYIFIFMFLLVGPIVSRLSLMQVTNLLRTTNELGGRRQVVIACALTFIVPDFFLFVSSCAKAYFGKRMSISLRTGIYVIIVEGMYAAGICLLVLKVLPFLDILTASALFNTIGLVPSVMNLVTSSKPKRTRKSVFFYCLTVFSVIAHIFLFFFLVYYVFTTVSYVKPFIIMIQSNMTSQNNTTLPASGVATATIGYMCFGALGVSIRWWENFARKDLTIGKLTIPFKTFAADLHDRRDKTYILASFWRMAVFTGVIFIFESDITAPLGDAKVSVNWWLIGSCLVHVAVSYFAYHLSTVACKLCIQIVAFSMPLNIGGFLYFISVCIYTAFISHQLFSIPEYLQPILPDLDEYPVYMYISIICCFASQLWLNRHVWTPSNKRLAPSTRIFTLPQYCGLNVEQSLLLTRRRDDNFEETRSEANDQRTEETDTSDDDPVTRIKICATMWHEDENEMLQMFISVCRLDSDQSARKIAKETFKYDDPDYYEFDAHVFFDDAMETKDNFRKPNGYVKCMMKVIEQAASVVNGRAVKLKDPVKMATPYGGRLVWTLPGENTITIHMKDKEKARNKKRWSQVMYMYYLLGHCIVEKECRDHFSNNNVKSDQEKCLLDLLPADIRKQVNRTFILALDGDIDFQPEAVRLLVDRMKKNDKVGAACGRIKPVGSGPVAWYQKFEYAVGHWLTKAAEHMYGCVLCSPGCFSLFRASALMDDNVMRTYAIDPTKPRQYLQYDQGEDRWLCTLILQQKYRIEYCAASDAFTHCPESFREFFNQRRRWIPSTMANIIDLLQSYSHTVKVNDNISSLYMIYQAILMGSTVLGPATILLMIMSSIQEIFRISYWLAGLITILPTVFFIIVCLKCKESFQIQVAMILSAVFALVMMTVIVGTLWNFTREGWLTPSAIFLYILVGSFLIAGFSHPQELSDLIWGGLYFICIPSGFLFLMIYSICNLHVTSWGTRETKTFQAPTAISSAQAASTHRTDELSSAVISLQNQRAEESEQDTNMFVRWFRSMGCCRRMSSTSSTMVLLQMIMQSLQRLEQNRNIHTPDESSTDHPESSYDINAQDNMYAASIEIVEHRAATVTASRDGDNRITNRGAENWLADSEFQNGDIAFLDSVEEEFWIRLVQTYLRPLPKDPEREMKVADSLKDLRNKVVAGFFMINSLWLVIMMAMQQVQDSVNIVIEIYDGEVVKLQPLGLAYLGIFGIILTLQFMAMIKHRYGTLMHILATTNICKPSSLQKSEQEHKDVIEMAKGLQQLDPALDIIDQHSRITDDEEDNVKPRENGYLPRYTTNNVMNGHAFHNPETNEHASRYYNDRFGREYLKNVARQPATGTFSQAFARRFNNYLTNTRGTQGRGGDRKIDLLNQLIDSNEVFRNKRPSFDNYSYNV